MRNDDVKKNYYLSDNLLQRVQGWHRVSILHATYVETEMPCPLFNIA